MNAYRVRLTVEGEHVEDDVLAENALHAIRQALALWHQYVPETGAVVSARKVNQ